MTIVTPLPEFIVLEEEMIAVEEYLLWLADLEAAALEGATLIALEAEGGLILEAAIMVGFIAVLAFAISELEETAPQAEVEAQKKDINEKRTRRKTAICGSKCLSILSFAKSRVGKGLYDGNPLKTVENDKRKRRKFKSRA